MDNSKYITVERGRFDVSLCRFCGLEGSGTPLYIRVAYSNSDYYIIEPEAKPEDREAITEFAEWHELKPDTDSKTTMAYLAQ